MRPWALALGGSLALHAFLVVAAFRADDLLPAPPPKVEKRGDGFVSFTAVSLVGQQAPASAAPAKPGGALVRAAATGERPAAAPAPVAVAVEPGDGVAGNGPLAPEAGAPGEGAPEGVVAALPAPVPAVASSGPQADEVIALVHARLAAVADRCYPAAARRFQQRGTVQLSFCTDANGGTASTSVTQSSGAELLDAAARGCVLENAAPFPREASARCFSVPVRFGLGH